jgi:hypothetical protein
MIKKLILFLFLPIFSFSQITTSELNGRVKEKTGNIVPHTSIQIIYVPTGTKYSSSADDKGIYHFYNASVGGPYIIKATSVGFKPFQKEDVFLTLGQNNDLNIVLEEENKQLKEVIVTTTKSLKNSSGMFISEDRVKSVPILSRSITDITKLVPQSVNNSFAGTNFRYNNVTIDGTINNDVIGFSPSLGGQGNTSGMPGSSTRTSPISIDAIKDIQVYIAPFDVKVGNFLGGSINAITRSGTNKVEGSVYTFGKNSSLAGFDNTKGFQDGQYGFRVGLPLIKNKLFFFTNEEVTDRTEPVQYNANGRGLISDSLANVISTFVKTKYGFNVGNYDDYTIYSRSKKYFNRLDWNINNHNQLTLRNNTTTSEATNLERDLTNFRFSSMDFKQNNTQSSTVMELRSHYGKKSNSLILGYTDIHDYRTPLSGNFAFPQTEIAYNGGTIFLGNEREATVFNLKQKTKELTDNFNFTLGKHSLLIGTHNEFYDIDYGFVNSWNGRVSYKSVADFLSSNVNRVRGFYSTINNDRDYIFNNPYAQFKVNLLSGYVQDEINFGKLKITPGIRYDYAQLPNKPSLSSQAAAGYTNDYLNNGVISPRLGFNYDVNGDKSLIVRGGSGVFVGRIPFAWIGYAFYNDGIGFGSFDVNNVAGKNVGDVLTTPAKQFAFNNGQSNLVQTDLIANGFKMPKVWRSNLAIDKTISGYKLTLEGLYTQVITDLMFQQINFKTDEANYGFFSYDTKHQMPIYNGVKINSKLSNAYALSNTDKGYRYQGTISLTKKYKFGLDVYGAYTYGISKDITNGIRNSMESNWQLNQSLTPNNPQLAYSNFDIRHRIISQITKKIKSTSVSFVLNSQSGIPFTWGLVNSTIAGTPQSAGLAYIFKDLTEATKYIPTAGQAQSFMDYVNSNSYLSSRKGNFTERNGGRTPWSTTIDTRLTQNVGKHLQLTADIFNLTNLINNEWGNIYFVSNTFNSTSSVGLSKTSGSFSSAGVLTDAKFSYSKPTQLPYSIDGINSKWQIQLGLRYNF